MQLRRLEVRNIRSYDRAELTLPPGTTLLVGDVGAGKTSLLYAIEMALFGFAEVDATYLVRHGAAHAEVALTLEDESHRFELRRRFRRKSVRGKETFQLESSTYAEDGATRAYSATELRRHTINLLGFPDNPNPQAHSDLWRWAVYIPQEAMRGVLNQRPSDRLETVRKALGLEQYRVAADNAQAVASELDHRAENHESEARGLGLPAAELDRWIREQASAREELGGLRKAESTAREALATAVTELNRLVADEARQAALSAESGLLAEQRRSLDETLRRGERQLEDLRSARSADGDRTQEEALLDEQLRLLAAQREEQRRAVNETQSTRDRLRPQVDRLTALRATLETTRRNRERTAVELQELGPAIDEAAHQLSELEHATPAREPPAPTRRSLQEIGAEIEAARAALELAQVELARSEQVLGEVDELLRDGRCPRCHQSVTPEAFSDHRQELSAARDTVRATVGAATARCSHLDEERRSRERYERALLRWQALEASRSAARGRQEDLSRQEQNLRSRLSEADATERESVVLEGQLQRATEEYERALGQIATLESTLRTSEAEQLRLVRQREEARARVAEAKHRESEIGRLETELEGRRAEVNRLEARWVLVSHQTSGLAQTRAALAAAESERDRLQRRVDEMGRQLGSLERALVHADERRDEAERAQQRMAQLRETATHERALGKWLSTTFRETMMAVEQRLLARAQSEFETVFARYFNALVDDPALVARCDAAFAPAVEIEGEWTPPEALSGGERTALALAYRLSLGHVVRSFGGLRLSTLILDEPTDGFSPEQVVRMGELLEQLDLPQVLLVSHEGGLASIASRVIRVRKEGGISHLEQPDSPPAGPSSTASATESEPVPARRARRRSRARPEPTLDGPGQGAQ